VAHDPMTERQGAARLVRWASRALLVVSGVAAGTAAAWAVSSATASAAPVEEPVAPSITPITDATAANLRGMTRGTAELVGDASGAASAAMANAACQQEATSWSIPSSESGHPAAPAGCREHGTHRVIDRDVSEKVRDTVDKFADNAVVAPVERTLGAVEHIVVKPEDAPKVVEESLKPSDNADFGKDLWNLLHKNDGQGGLLDLPAFPGLGQGPVEHGVLPETPEAVRDAATPLTGPATVELPGAAEAAASRLARSAGLTETNNQTSLNSDDQGDFPAPFAPIGMPIAPLSAPTVPGGSAPGGHLDGPAYGVPAWSSAGYYDAKTGTLRVGVRHMPLTPGSQPGVTPD
jgi:hypothetical protein